MSDSDFRLLSPDDPHPVKLHREDGASPFFLTCDHAGNAIPQRLGDLGVSESERRRHIAWDVGAEHVARHLADYLDAPLVAQTYSRLVIDCNRSVGVADSIATISEHTEVPGNHALATHEAAARAAEIFHPYQNTITEHLDRRHAAGVDNVLICVHSFTPVYKGQDRPWHIGVLYNRDDSLARVLMELIAAETDLCLGDNEPYAISDETDYTIPVHGEQRGIPHVEIEIRHDLIETAGGQSDWAARLADWLPRCLARL